MRPKPRTSAIVNKADIPQPGEHYGVPARPYRYRGSGRTDGAKTYTLDGTEHRFDGACHADCPDVR